MRSKIFILLLTFIIFGIGHKTAFSQTNCTGEKIFAEKRCEGDEISSQEKELYQIVNDYRARNNLPLIPISESLSMVANRHLLDLVLNVKSLTHGWSNCAFDMNDQKSWGCALDSPKRLNSGYNGRGFENLYRSKTGNASAVLALEAWKKSDLHNSLLLNLKTFKETRFDAFGIAINGQYAALWFGSNMSGETESVKNSAVGESLALSFEKVVSGLTDFLTTGKSQSFINGKWRGGSGDNTVLMELTGSKEDLREAVVSIIPDENNQLNQKQRDIFSRFLKNAAEEWSGRENWLNTSLAKIQQNSKMPQTITLESKVFVLAFDLQNRLSLTVKPYKKTGVKLL